MKRSYSYAYEQARIQRERERAQFEADQQREAEERKRQNQEARERYLAGHEAKKAEKRQADEAAIDAQLEPTKQRLRRQWLVDHPGENEKSFESRAWPLLGANLVEEAKSAEQQSMVESLRRDPRYQSL